MQAQNLYDLYVAKLQDLYSAEEQITHALPKMIKAAQNADLENGLSFHLTQTSEHIKRLERIFAGLSKQPGGHLCEAMKGIIEEGENSLKGAKGEGLDAMIISSAQSVEHYEIAGYGTAVTYATLLNMKEAVDMLERTLTEEKETDLKLSHLAKAVNVEAL